MGGGVTLGKNPSEEPSQPCHIIVVTVSKARHSFHKDYLKGTIRTPRPLSPTGQYGKHYHTTLPTDVLGPMFSFQKLGGKQFGYLFEESV